MNYDLNKIFHGYTDTLVYIIIPYNLNKILSYKFMKILYLDTANNFNYTVIVTGY